MNKVHRLQILAAIALVILGASSASAQIVCDPETLELNELTSPDDVVFNYTGGSVTPVAGYSLHIEWDISLATAVFTRPDNGPFNGAITFFVVDLGPGHVRIDAAIGGTTTITSGELCKGMFTGVVSAVGTSGIDLTMDHMRDSGNQDINDVPAPVDGTLAVDMVGAPMVENVLIVNNTLLHTDDFVKDTDSITVTADVSDIGGGLLLTDIEADLTDLGGGDNVNPETYASDVATWNLASVTCETPDGPLTVTVTATDALLNEGSNSDTITADNTPPTALTGVLVTPGHQQLHLAWDEISGRDAYPKGVEFRYVAWGDYPAYDLGEPSYPGDHEAETFGLQEESLLTADLPILDPDIYYVAGFVYDIALNYGPTGTLNQGRATNYWLGDTNGNGTVDISPDIDALGDTYGLADTHGPPFDELCDVGPTDTGSPLGIPEPNRDHEVGFEDMMVFALNWSVVTPSTKILEGGTPVLAWHQIDDTTWALSLEEKGGDLQGLNLRADLPEGVDCTVARGDLLAEQSGPIFLRNIPRNGIDAGLAQFGQGSGFSGSGELVRVALSKPVEDLRISVTARGEDNKELSVELGSGGTETVPSVASFAQNYPNPFNPRTTLAYELPQERQVHLAIYAVDGTRVRTLVEGPREAGHHEVSWDGRDDTGRSMAAGTYFARISAGDLNQIKKMVLVK